MRWWIPLTIVALTVAAAPADWIALGIGGPIGRYHVASTGEIAFLDSTPEGSTFSVLDLDAAGRMVLTARSDRLTLHRIQRDGTLTLADTATLEGEQFFSATHASLSRDGRILLARVSDGGGNPEREFRTLGINNRLELNWTGFALNTQFSNIDDWFVSNRGEYTGVVNRAFRQKLRLLSITPSGELIDTGMETDTPVLQNTLWDVSDDGQWAINGQQIGQTDVSLFEVTDGGDVLLSDSRAYPEIGWVAFTRLFPDLSRVAISGDPTISIAELLPNGQFGEILDQDVPPDGSTGAGGAGLAISPDGSMLLVTDQRDPQLDFRMYSYFVSESGQLTHTGHSIPIGFHLILRAIPPPTPVTLPGDANLDGLVNSADVVFLVNEAMPDDKPILLPQNFANADLDGDVDVDEDDLQGLVDLLLAR